MQEDQNHVFPEPQNNQNQQNPQYQANQPGMNVAPTNPNPNPQPDNTQYQQQAPQTPPQPQNNAPQPVPQPQQNQDIPTYSNPLTTGNQNASQEQYSAPEYGAFDINQGQPGVQKTKNKDANSAKINKNVQNIKEKVMAFLTTKWWVVVGIVLIIALIASVSFYFVNQPEQFDSTAFTNVTGRIQAPSTSPSGSPARWQVVIQNRESVAINNIEVKLEFDRAFQYIKPISPDPASPSGDTYRFPSLSGLGQGTSEVIIQFEGVLTGNIDENTIMTGSVTYTPEPLLDSRNSTRTATILEAQTRITAPEIKVSLTSTSGSVQNGGEVDIIASFENLSERDLRNIRIEMEYPSGSNFEYLSSELRLQNADVQTQPDDGRNIWFINTLPRLQTSTLAIKGNLFGADGVRETFRIIISAEGVDGDFEPLATDVIDILVTSQPLVISTRIEGKDTNRVFRPGETLNFVIDYQNRSNNTIQNIELFGLVDDPANLLDYSTTTFVGGDIGNLNNRVINWRGSGVPQLITMTPQVSGSVRYSVKVKSGEAFIESRLNQSSYTLRPRAQAKATNIPQFEVGGDLYQGQGDMTFDQTVEGLERDPNQSNRQTFRITWEINTRQNQVNDVVIETVSPLPPTAWKQASIQPSGNAGEISYDPLTGRIRWVPGIIPAYTGIDSDPKRITFELDVVAPSNTALRSITMLDEISAIGIDDFTGERYEVTKGETKAID
jgi:hypothetical protein